jgi:hypothetical protein
MRISGFGRYALGCVAVAMLAGCGGSQLPIGAPGAAPQSRAIAKHADRGFLGKSRTTSCPCLYVANSNDSVTVYASGATGNAKPIEDIRGSQTGLSHPHDVAVDGSGNVYVVNIAPTSITVYAPGATGNAKPIETISGSNTGLASATGIAIDPDNGDIYVSNIAGGRSGRGSVTIYAPGSNGNVSPLGAIQGPKTRLDHPNCLAVDASGNIAVTNAYGYVTIYVPGSTGNIAPTRTVAGALTKLKDPTQVTVDSSLNTYVANARNNGLTVYGADAHGNVAPIQDIHGRRTNLRVPFGAAVDTAGNIYAASGIGVQSGITVYATGSNGNVLPIDTIKGSQTGLVYPQGIAIH